MLFLLALLAAFAGTGIIDFFFKKIWRRFFKKNKTSKEGVVPTSKDIKNLSKNDLKRASKRISIGELVQVYSRLTDTQKSQLRRAIYKGVASRNWNLKDEYEQFMKSIRWALLLKSRGRKTTSNQDKLIEVATDLLIDSKNTSKYEFARSSWIIATKYTPRTKLLWVKMKRGKVIYKFPNVPPVDYLLLITCAGTMGTFWWREWYWKYSTNPRWKLRRRRRK